VAQVGAGSVTDASGSHEPPVAADPSVVKPAPVPHPVTAVCTLTQLPGVTETALHPVADEQLPVANWSWIAPQAEPDGEPQLQLHWAGAAVGERPPSNPGR
jgi:hypothetical protein